MNIINLRVNFAKGNVKITGIDLVENDYNSTKIVFEFDTEEGQKLFKMNNPLGELVYSDYIINNELILGGRDENQNVVSLFSMAGQYPFEVVLYNNGSKLTSTHDYLTVEQEVVKIGDEVAEVYLPVFDEMVQQLQNLNITAEKVGTTTTITITKKDGTPQTAEILDGQTGVGIASVEKTSTSGLVDTYTITYTNGNTTTFNVTNGKDGEDYVITPSDYNAIAGIVETDIAPTISGIQDTANNANNTANTAKSIAEGANQALAYGNYSTMITAFNSLPKTTYRVGQNIYINTLQVPDLWVYSVEDTSVTYTYTTDEAFVNEIATNGYVQVGYYRLGALETQKVDLTDYVTNTDYATTLKGGVIKLSNAYATDIASGIMFAGIRTYEQYQTANDRTFIGKGTLENVITGKELVSKNAYLTGSSAPTTSTVAPFVGALYIDTTNNKTYQCTAITTENNETTYTWVNLIRQTDYATSSTGGVVKVGSNYGVGITSNDNSLYVRKATSSDIDGKSNDYKPIVPSNLDYAVASIVGHHETLTQAQYDALETKDNNTYYYIIEE